LQKYEKRVLAKEESIDKKADAVEKREAECTARLNELQKKEKRVEELELKGVQELERVSGLTSEQAKEELLRSVEDDVNYTMETVAHFTTNNSILPTDEIISIAIQESSGEVFIGTSGGLVSYMSDATKPEETYDELYAYPNPVHPTYQGYITIKGLMDDSEVRIVDASGNLVKILYGTGGTVVWDGTNAQGQRVGAGVYTGLCNTKSGSGHGTIKILILNKN
jgi:hypothetical protein